MRLMIGRWSARFSVFLAVVVLAGCAAGRGEFKRGEDALQQGDYQQAVASLREATEKAPDNHAYKLRLNTARYEAAKFHWNKAEEYFAQADYQQAREHYRLSAELDGSNFAAAEGYKLAGQYQKAQKLVIDAADFVKANRHLQARRAVEQALDQVEDFQPALQLKKVLERTALTVIDGVELEVISDQPITLNFTDTKLPDVFEILTNLSGINFILDEDVRSNKTTLFLEKATFSQALELLLRMNKLDKKILNRKTIVLFPKTRDKQKQFEDQLIHTFYLSNIDAKKAVNLLRTMLQVRKIYVHEELNAVVIRDTPGVIKLAAKIIEANDRGDAEVVFDLELIEVLHTDGLTFGPQLGAYQLNIGINPDPTTTATSISGVVVDSFDGFDTLYGLPAASFDFLKEASDSEVLANPKIRVRNKEKAKVHIGTREPVVTVTVTDSGTTSDNVAYQDVGVKLDVEPEIQLDNTVVTKLGLEVSNVSGRSTTANGTSVLTITTTNANTALTLKDGERTIIGGLLRDSESKAKTTIPVLGDIPLLGRLFTHYQNTDSKSEILLSITPHIVRSVKLPTRESASIWSGGEDDLKFGRNFGTFADEYLEGQQDVELINSDSETEAAAEPVDAAPVPVLPVEKVEPAAVPAAVPATAAVVEPESAATAEELVVTADDPVEEVTLPVQQPSGMLQPLIYIKGSELVKNGEEFSLIFYVDEISELFSAPMYVQYDSNLFDFVSATEGGFLKQGDSPTVFTHTVLKDSARVIVGLKQGAGGKGVSGGGELFSMTFKAKALGKGLIEPTRTNFRNPQGIRLNAEPIGLEIEVH
ncbi:general secretion pathway protein D [Malonomonas rubra DSM 5091]|uniref:General secretion pathway protein D n=1 Tax=Malonomonas rubra DSM 5091 TaxID=1122189 RepID=A0A1M6BCD6_MALRU|nr:secretin N-terminal domain-containing protein [Malonomonas rubra]SHI46410.1 general secretion pathway protein D [Malonomonas rubra DSM 5091]